MNDLRSERGQAVTETMLASWIVILFVAAIYQVFLANQTVYRSLTAAHTELMRDAFNWNCAGNDVPFAPPGPWCDYQGGLTRTMNAGQPADVIYNRFTLPEIFVPVVGLFAEHAATQFSTDQRSVYGLLAHAIDGDRSIPPFTAVSELRLWSGSPFNPEPDAGCGMGTAESNAAGPAERPACKRTKAGAGPYLPLTDAFVHMGLVTGVVGNPMGDIGAFLKNWLLLKQLVEDPAGVLGGGVL